MTEPNRAHDQKGALPPASLQARVLMEDGKGEGWDPAPLRRAEQAMAVLSKDFDKWMDEEAERLDEMRRHYHAQPGDPERRGALFRAAHDMRGHATTFGFPLASTVAEGLCELIENLDHYGAGIQSLVDAHVDAIRAIERDGVRDTHNRTVLAVISALATARTALLHPADAA
jgi:chemotaxis protein histidine kinase CheA